MTTAILSPPEPSAPRRSASRSTSKSRPTQDLRLLASVLDDLPMRIMLCDLDLDIRYVNKAALLGLESLEQYLPVPASRVVGSNLDIFHADPRHQRRILASDEQLPTRAVIQVGPESLDLTVKAVYDEDGVFCGAMASWELVTERLRAERDKAADEAAVARVLQEMTVASTTEETLRAVVDSVRREFGWSCATWWKVGDDALLHPDLGSCVAGEELRRLTLATSYAPGVGLLGQAWRDRDVKAVCDITTVDTSPRAAAMAGARVPVVMGLPVTVDDEVVGVLEFIGSEGHLPSPDRLDTLRDAASLVSEAVERVAHLEQESRAAEELARKVDLILEVVAAAATGDFTAEVRVTGDDAVGRLGAGMAALLQIVRSSMTEIGATVESLSLAVQHLNGLSTQLSDDAEDADERTTKASATAEHVTERVQSAATAAEEMTVSISEIARNASDAASVATTAVGVASGARSTVTSLGESSAEIGQVIKVITSIAQQTNLLALNATIEAARAGDAGKGFAVVANEVKELAKETAKATEDVSRKIEAIQADTRDAVEGIGQIASIIDQVNDIQTTIASAVEEQSVTTNEIARNVSEAAIGAGDIYGMVSKMAAAASDGRQGASDATFAAQALTEITDELQQLLTRFHY